MDRSFIIFNISSIFILSLYYYYNSISSVLVVSETSLLSPLVRMSVGLMVSWSVIILSYTSHDPIGALVIIFVPVRELLVCQA